MTHVTDISFIETLPAKEREFIRLHEELHAAHIKRSEKERLAKIKMYSNLPDDWNQAQDAIIEKRFAYLK